MPEYGTSQQLLATAIVDEMVKRGVGSGGGGGGGAIAAGENFIGAVGGRTIEVQTSFTRPLDTTAYAAGDAVSDSTSTPSSFAFANAARVAAGSGVIVAAKLTKNSTATAGASFRLWIFESAPTYVNDNAAMAILWANRAVRRGYIDFSSPVVGSDCCEYYGSPNQQMTFKLGNGVTSLYFLLQATGAYTPASGEQFSAEISILQD